LLRLRGCLKRCQAQFDRTSALSHGLLRGLQNFDDSQSSTAAGDRFLILSDALEEVVDFPAQGFVSVNLWSEHVPVR